MANTPETEKYEVLEKIGKCRPILVIARKLTSVFKAMAASASSTKSSGRVTDRSVIMAHDA